MVFDQTRVEGCAITPPCLPFCLPHPLCLSVCRSFCLLRSLSLTHTHTHSLSPRLAQHPHHRSAFPNPRPHHSRCSYSPRGTHSLPSLYSIAPASRSTFATSSLPACRAICSGVSPNCGAGEAVSAQASCAPHAADPKAPPPLTLPRSHSLSNLLRWYCCALPPHALHLPHADPCMGVWGVGCGVRAQ